VLGVLVILAPIALYLAAALSVHRKDLLYPDDFFTAHRRADVTMFSTSSIAYAFQMSTIYPFLIWGAAHFFFVPIVNTVCWGIGIFLFYLASSRYQEFIGNDQTLHGFLGNQYGQSVRRMASYLTITGLLGFAVAELYFGSRVLLSVSGGKGAYAFIVAVSLIVYGYIAYGGQLSSMRTDQLQLAISYIGMFGISLYFLHVILTSAAMVPSSLKVASAVCILYVPVILYARRGTFFRVNFWGIFGARTGVVLNTLAVLLLAVMWIFALLLIPRPTSGSASWRFFDLTGFGIPGLLSLIILPVCFQFVDLTNWQRLLSVKPSLRPGHDLRKDIGKGLLTYALESPFTWLLSLFFGLLVTSAVAGIDATDLLVNLPQHLMQSANASDHLVAYAFILSVVSIMLSTVDSFMVGVIYTFAYDSYPSSQRLLDTGNVAAITEKARHIINVGRAFGLLSLATVIAALFVFDHSIPNGGELFVNLLLAFYSAQLSFFPLVFGVLFLRTRPSSGWAVLSMLLGAGSGIGLGIYAVIWNTKYAWFPLLLCFLVSCLVYSVGYAQARRKLAARTIAI
jgi:Na+/proline symporter